MLAMLNFLEKIYAVALYNTWKNRKASVKKTGCQIIFLHKKYQLTKWEAILHGKNVIHKCRLLIHCLVIAFDHWHDLENCSACNKNLTEFYFSKKVSKTIKTSTEKL